MVYNMDFLISSLIFLLLILYHFMSQRRIDDFNNRSFLVFLLIGIVDVFFDMFCTILISAHCYEYSNLLEVSMTVLYLMQVAVPYVLFFYSQTLRQCSPERKRRFITIWTIPALLMAIVVCINKWTGWLFYFNEKGEYIRGTMYLGMYAYAAVYVFIIACTSIFFHKELSRRKCITIWELLLVMGTCVAIQAYDNNILMTGFGIGLGITILFLTINNPYEYSDNLTGVFDAKYFSEWAQRQMDRKKTFHVITVDLFYLKRINKIYGSSFGDRILIEAAKEMQLISRGGRVFRITGNRFLLIEETLYEYERMRNDIQKYFEKEFEIYGEHIKLPVITCGVLEAEKLGKCDTLLGYIEYLVSLVPDFSDSVLIQSDEQTIKGFMYSKEIERFLKQAIEDDLFEVYYQPVYSFETGQYITLEALSRLRHPSYGPVSPELFIGLAEKNGQIAEIGYLQFRKICHFIKEHEEIFSVIRNVKVNLSPAELLKPGYREKIIQTVKEYGLSGRYFQFEITENVATDYSENLYETVKMFAKEGIEFCLDDFGSGYANLNTVLKLPFSSIKLDKSLLRGVEEDEQLALFYQNIVSVLQMVGYLVIAEGVETEREMNLVKKWGVNMVQGYYFSKPVPEEKLLEILRIH